MPLKTVKEVLDSVAASQGKRCFFYFMASPDDTGESWCPDCRKAQPYVDEAVKKLPADAVFFSVWTGDRPTWKDPHNEFRLCTDLHVTNVPTLLEFGKEKRLVDPDIYDVDKILELFN